MAVATEEQASNNPTWPPPPPRATPNQSYSKPTTSSSTMPYGPLHQSWPEWCTGLVAIAATLLLDATCFGLIFASFYYATVWLVDTEVLPSRTAYAYYGQERVKRNIPNVHGSLVQSSLSIAFLNGLAAVYKYRKRLEDHAAASGITTMRALMDRLLYDYFLAYTCISLLQVSVCLWNWWGFSFNQPEVSYPSSAIKQAEAPSHPLPANPK